VPTKAFSLGRAQEIRREEGWGGYDGRSEAPYLSFETPLDLTASRKKPLLIKKRGLEEKLRRKKKGGGGGWGGGGGLVWDSGRAR